MTNDETLRVNPRDGKERLFMDAFPKAKYKGTSNELLLLQTLLSFSSPANPLNRFEIGNIILACYGINLSNKAISLAWSKLNNTFLDRDWRSWFELKSCGKKGYWARLKSEVAPNLALASLIASYSSSDIGYKATELLRKYTSNATNEAKASVRAVIGQVNPSRLQHDDYKDEDTINNQLRILMDAISKKKPLMFDHCFTSKTSKRVNDFSPYRIYMKDGCFYAIGSIECADRDGKTAYETYVAKLIHMKNIAEDEDGKYSDMTNLFLFDEDIHIQPSHLLKEGKQWWFHNHLMNFSGIVNDHLLSYSSANFSETLWEQDLPNGFPHKNCHYINFSGQKEMVLGFVLTHTNDILFIESNCKDAITKAITEINVLTRK